jgi:hypothetical protein
MELALSISLGIGLSAACGFRIFVPLLVMSFAANAGHINLSDGFDWIATWPAFVCFLTATILEIAVYYIPWLDNLLDTIATPAAVVAGTIIMSAVNTAPAITDMSPLLKWSLALIAGGGTAGVIQSTTTALRGVSSVSTGGLANFAIASAELVASVATTVLSIVLPILTALGIAVLLVVFLCFARRRFQSVERDPHTA